MNRPSRPRPGTASRPLPFASSNVAASWDRETQTLVVSGSVGGRSLRVSVPIAIVDSAYDAELGAVGILVAPEVGYYPSVDGLLKRARRAVKRFGKKAGRALGKAVKKVSRAALKVAKGPIGKAVMAGAALAMPAVGGPALAALAAANKVRRVIEAADKGNRKAKAALPGISAATQRLAQGSDAVSRVAVAALRSL